jgi:hypothetical protein
LLLLLAPTEGKGRIGACLFSLGTDEESDLLWFVESRLQSPSEGREVMIAAAAAAEGAPPLVDVVLVAGEGLLEGVLR